MERGTEMKRSLLVNILIIMLVTLVVLVALVMVIITIVGKSVYSRQRANELMSRAESIASEFAFSRDAGIPNDEIRKNLISKGLIESDTTTIIYLSGKEIWNSFPVLLSIARASILLKRITNALQEEKEYRSQMIRMLS